jgi:aldose 1-epimerase
MEFPRIQRRCDMTGAMGHAGQTAVAMFVLMLALGCQKQSGSDKTDESTQMKKELNVTKVPFGKTPDGREVDLYTLTNAKGAKASIMTYGGIVVSLDVPDRNGKLDDIVLGYDNLGGYLTKTPYFGAIVGRYGNRIANGRFTLGGVTYKLATNDGKNHLHGGLKGFDKVVWDAEPVKQDSAVGVRLSYLSKDGEEGYPGNLSCTVVYLLTNSNELVITYDATTDKPTIINLTHHSYFNLAGQGNGDVLSHELLIKAAKYTPVDKGLIPTGELKDVKGTPMDFTTPTAIGARIAEVEGGYDHNYVLDSGGGSMALAARVYEPTTGRVMEVLTTQPGIQFYSGNFLDGTITGKGGKVYKKHYGFCLETQHFPDSPNKPNFPSVVLNPGERYKQETIYRFSAR